MAASNYILRHGMTKSNIKSDEKMRGHSKIELDAQGREQARKAGGFLKGKGIKKIYSSDLPRAVETAQIISRILGNVPIELNKDLRTWDPGILTGRKVKDVQGAVDYYEKHGDVAPPGGQTINNFIKQVNRVDAKLKNRARHTGQNTAIVTHTRPILTMKARMLPGHGHKFEKMWKTAPGPGSILKMTETAGGKVVIKQVFGDEENDQRS